MTLMTATQENTEATASPEGQTAETEVEEGQAQPEEGQGQPEGEKAVEGEKQPSEGEEPKEGEPEKPKGTPGAYADFTTPEGVELNAEVLADFKDQAKALNMDQAQAQSVVDLGIKLQQSWADEANAAIDQTIAGWEEAARADKDIGGEGLEENLTLAKKVADRFGSETFRTELVEKYKLGSHPEFIRFCRDIAKTVSEDSMVSASGEAEKPREFGAGWFNHPTSKTSS